MVFVKHAPKEGERSPMDDAGGAGTGGGAGRPATVADVIRAVEDLAPRELAEEWDNVGLVAGNPRATVTRLLTAVDLTSRIVDEAASFGAQAVVVHHPPIFDSIRTLRSDQPVGAVLSRAVEKGLAVYAAHTNLDVAPGGINDVLAELIDLRRAEGVGDRRERLCKLVVFVPKGHEDAVREAVSEAGAGWIGNYSHCTFQAPGTGTFKPLEGADPFIGSVGKLEKADEFRLETVVPAVRLGRVLQAMRGAHPYEEIAYDVYPLRNEGRTLGPGLVGEIAPPRDLRAFAGHVKERLGVPAVRVTGDLDREVRRVGLMAGAGAYVAEVARAGADVFFAGEFKYDRLFSAVEHGLATVEAGHYATEAPGMRALAGRVERKLLRAGFQVEVRAAAGRAYDPATWV